MISPLFIFYFLPISSSDQGKIFYIRRNQNVDHLILFAHHHELKACKIVEAAIFKHTHVHGCFTHVVSIRRGLERAEVTGKMASTYGHRTDPTYCRWTPFLHRLRTVTVGFSPFAYRAFQSIVGPLDFF